MFPSAEQEIIFLFLCLMKELKTLRILKIQRMLELITQNATDRFTQIHSSEIERIILEMKIL